MSEDRTKRGVRDLVLSLAVVGIFVAFLYVIVWRPSPEPVRTVDPALQLEAARAQSPYPVLAPEGLGADWKPTSARFEMTTEGVSTWFLGYVTPQMQYVALAQSDGQPEAFIAEQTLRGQKEGERQVNGRIWQEYVSGDQRSLVRVGDAATTVVTGTVSYDELAAFAGRLSA